MKGFIIHETENAYKIKKVSKKIEWVPKSMVKEIIIGGISEKGYRRPDKFILYERR